MNIQSQSFSSSFLLWNYPCIGSQSASQEIYHLMRKNLIIQEVSHDILMGKFKQHKWEFVLRWIQKLSHRNISQTVESHSCLQTQTSLLQLFAWYYQLVQKVSCQKNQKISHWLMRQSELQQKIKMILPMIMHLWDSILILGLVWSMILS